MKGSDNNSRGKLDYKYRNLQSYKNNTFYMNLPSWKACTVPLLVGDEFLRQLNPFSKDCILVPACLYSKYWNLVD